MYMPRAQSTLSITLPGEILRAVVTKIVNRDVVLVELGQPMMRSHTYRMGDLVACRRTATDLGETWQVIEERRTAPDLLRIDSLATPEKSIVKPIKIDQKTSKTAINAKSDTKTRVQRSAKARR